MSLFNVVQPCVVNGLHYVHPTKQPIEVDDDQAAELVAAGSLEPYPKPAAKVEIGDGKGEEVAIESETPRRSRRPRSED